MLLPTLSGYWVWQELEKRTEMEIGGSFSPRFFLPSFYLKDAHFAWDEKIHLVSGTIKVEYDLLALLSGGHLRVKLSSQDLTVKLLGELAEMEGVSDVRFDHFYADLTFGREGIEEIFSLQAESPTIQFHFGEARQRPSKTLTQTGDGA